MNRAQSVAVVVWVSVAFIGLSARHALATPLVPGNLIASVNEFTGSATAPTYIAEYTTSGTRVQILSNVPRPDGGPGATTEQARDLVLGPGNAIHLYNGTFDPQLARFDLDTSVWAQQTFEGWSTVNNISYGGIGVLDEFVFATDMETFGPGDTPSGIVRFDTTGGPTVRFAEDIEPVDLYVGPDGFIYGLDGDDVFRYDPFTFALLGTVSLGFDDNRALAIAEDGSLIVATWDGRILHYSSTGALLGSIDVPFANFADVDIDPFGNIALGTGFDGEIVLTDLSLSSFERFRATDSTSGGEVFVAWVTAAVPEPSMVGLVIVAAVSLLSRHRRRTR